LSPKKKKKTSNTKESSNNDSNYLTEKANHADDELKNSKSLIHSDDDPLPSLLSDTRPKTAK
jgi:hypothetical protein